MQDFIDFMKGHPLTYPIIIVMCLIALFEAVYKDNVGTAMALLTGAAALAGHKLLPGKDGAN